MYNFFCEDKDKCGSAFLIMGNDYNHIKNVLRMKIGEELLISLNGCSYLCEIAQIDASAVTADIITEGFQSCELPIELHLFQGLPKSDKMELIIQKAVELGANKITPIEMNRCVVKLEEKKKAQKLARWQAIAESAAKQSRRGIIPEIGNVLTYKEALNAAKELDLLLVPYEAKDGMAATLSALSQIKAGSKIGIIIGPEGGFEDGEIKAATESGGKIISLGKRILRTETAAIAAISMCMLYAEINGDKL